ITPSTEVVERFAARIPTVGGLFIQMEDELAASIAIQGAVWGGAKAFTVTSGPGFSLMMEHIGYAAMTETPCVFVDVQRGGPSTGLPTLPPQADLVPDMVRAGDGYRFHVTGLTHDEQGYPSMNLETQDRMVRRLQDKLKPLANGRALFETEHLDDADVVVVSYGITSRVAQRATQLAREQGVK